MGVLETAVDDVVDYGFPPGCTKMLRNTVSRTQPDVSRLAIEGDPSAHVESMIQLLQPGAGMVRAKPSPERNGVPWNAAVLRRPPPGGDDDRRRGDWTRERAPENRCRAFPITRSQYCEERSRRFG